MRRICSLCTGGRHVGFADRGLAQQSNERCAPAILRVLFPGCLVTCSGILSSGSGCDISFGVFVLLSGNANAVLYAEVDKQ